MLSHRFRHLLDEDDRDHGSAPAANLAFMTFPVAVQQTMTQAQLAQVQQLYRLAFEQAQAKVATDDNPAVGLQGYRVHRVNIECMERAQVEARIE